jgi:uncharacterized membrane protein (UPF0136 family)
LSVACTAIVGGRPLIKFTFGGLVGVAFLETIYSTSNFVLSRFDIDNLGSHAFSGSIVGGFMGYRFHRGGRNGLIGGLVVGGLLGMTRSYLGDEIMPWTRQMWVRHRALLIVSHTNRPVPQPVKLPPELQMTPAQLRAHELLLEEIEKERQRELKVQQEITRKQTKKSIRDFTWSSLWPTTLIESISSTFEKVKGKVGDVVNNSSTADQSVNSKENDSGKEKTK